MSTARKDFDLVAKNESLLNNVKERTLDKKFKIRKEALTGLALIYKKHLSDPLSVPEATKMAVTWIKDKILHGKIYLELNIKYTFNPLCTMPQCTVIWMPDKLDLDGECVSNCSMDRFWMVSKYSDDLNTDYLNTGNIFENLTFRSSDLKWFGVLWKN